MRKQLLLSFLAPVLSVLTSAAQQPSPEPRTIDLRSLGYTLGDCKFPNARIEFVDSIRLLISFPGNSSCKGAEPYQTQQRRAAVVKVSGEVLHASNLQSGQFLLAGPSGHLLLPAENGLHILDADFLEIQTLPWSNGADAGRTPSWSWAANIFLTPSREGFAIQGPYPNYAIAYFEGNPIRLVFTLDTCSPVAAVTDGGIACLQQSPKSKVEVHSVNSSWDLEDSRFREREWLWAGLPTPDMLLLFSSKFKLFVFQRGGTVTQLADLHWLSPGLWNSGSSYSLTSSSAHRVLVSSWGCWLPLNDTTGIGLYKRVLVLDYLSGAVVFKRQYSIGSDVALSPDGHLLAVRENDQLSVVPLP